MSFRDPRERDAEERAHEERAHEERAHNVVVSKAGDANRPSAPVSSSAPLLLFDRPQSNNCARLRMWVHLKELEASFEIRATSQADQQSEEFGSLNPQRKIPMLLVRDGDEGPQPITESAVIAEYLEERFADRCSFHSPLIRFVPSVFDSSLTALQSLHP